MARALNLENYLEHGLMIPLAYQDTTWMEEETGKNLYQIFSDLELSIQRLNSENYIFECFLEEYEPLTATAQLRLTKIMTSITPESNRLSAVQSTTTLVDDNKSKDSTNVSITSLDRWPKLNLSHRKDLVFKYAERLKKRLDSLIKSKKIEKADLKAQREEISIRKAEVVEWLGVFEQKVVKEGRDPSTQKIQAEKFERFIQDWTKSADQMLQKIRVNLCGARVRAQGQNDLIDMKTELRKHVHIIDFEAIGIQNKELTVRGEKLNRFLQEVKEMISKASSLENKHKHVLRSLVAKQNDTKEEIKKCRDRIVLIDDETDAARLQLIAVEKIRNRLKKQFITCSVPSTLDYVRLKHDIHLTNKSIKTLQRKVKLQSVMIETIRGKLRKGIGRDKADFLYKLIVKGNLETVDKFLARVIPDFLTK